MPETRRAGLAAFYLVMTAIGYLAPGIPMVRESLLTGNILFWADPARTNAELFVNRTSTAFALDLVAVVVVAVVWMYRESRRIGLRGVWRFWLLTALFGLGGTLPLFLWFRERKLAQQAA